MLLNTGGFDFVTTVDLKNNCVDNHFVKAAKPQWG
jgi:hypothetical protein